MRLWVLPVIVAPGLLLGGCGATGEVDAEKLSEAAERTRASGTARVELSGDGEPAASGRGEIDYERRRARISFEVVENDELRTGEVVVVGTQLFMRSEPPLPGSHKPWLRMDRDDDPPTLDDLVFPFPFADPADVLEHIAAAKNDVEVLADDVVRGSNVKGYRVEIDLAAAIERAPERDRDSLRAELAQEEEKTRPLEVWIDDDQLVRRIRVRDANELITIDYYDFGADIEIEPPSSDQVETFEESLGLPATDVDPEKQPSARFVVHDPLMEEETNGMFDWRSRIGRARTTRPDGPMEIVQIGDDCYSRKNPGEWRTRKIDTCELVFENPATEDDLLTFVSGAKEIGTETVRGVNTTHYKGDLNIGAVKGPIEFWVDADGNTRKVVHGRTVQEWFDFGVKVQVERPAMAGKG